MTINRLNQDVTYLPAFRNLIINGAMQVAQRGTSVTGITAGGYLTADRWQTNLTTLGTWTQTVENDAPTGSGFRKSLKMLCTTADASPAAADLVRIEQLFEGQNLQSILKGTANAKQLTVSFWVKSNVTGTYVLRMFDEDNTRDVANTYTINSADTWEKKTITLPADTTGAFNNDNGRSAYLMWWLGAGSDRTSGTLATTWQSAVTANQAVGQTNLAAATNNYWQITGVQLEVGAVATPFEFKPFDQDLRECQRYYWRTTATSANGAICTAAAFSTTRVDPLAIFPVPMRTSPTAIESSNLAFRRSGGGFAAMSAIALDTASPAAGLLAATVSGVTAGEPGTVLGNNNAAAFLAFSAEL
jgi:phage gp37-like protein